MCVHVSVCVSACVRGFIHVCIMQASLVLRHPLFGFHIAKEEWESLGTRLGFSLPQT